MADLSAAIAAFRESIREGQPDWNMLRAGVNLLAALDAAQGQAVAWLCDARDGKNVEATVSENARDHHARRGRTISPLYLAAQSPPTSVSEGTAAVPAGYALVPVEPTDDMVRAGAWEFAECMANDVFSRAAAENIWSQMVAQATTAAARKGE